MTGPLMMVRLLQCFETIFNIHFFICYRHSTTTFHHHRLAEPHYWAFQATTWLTGHQERQQLTNQCCQWRREKGWRKYRTLHCRPLRGRPGKGTRSGSHCTHWGRHEIRGCRWDDSRWVIVVIALSWLLTFSLLIRRCSSWCHQRQAIAVFVAIQTEESTFAGDQKQGKPGKGHLLYCLNRMRDESMWWWEKGPGPVWSSSRLSRRTNFSFSRKQLF